MHLFSGHLTTDQNATVAAVLDGFVKYTTWDFWSELLQMLAGKSLLLLLIITLTWLALRARKLIISRVFLLTRLQKKQQDTLESLLLSFTRYVIFIISALLCLSNLGMDVAPIIASAGVIGLAVGFGAQTLVKDLITGFFIIFEDQFSVGDYVNINNGAINGTVVSVGLRATKIRTWAQHVVVIQNSEIKVSQNFNRERMRAIVNINVPYETEPALIERATRTISARMVSAMPHFFLMDDAGQPVEPPTLYGITDVENGALGAKYAVTCMVKDEFYFTACKELRKALIEELKQMGIPISYPRRIERQETELA
ncbi:mechanosensitive ion channel family protein [Paenibacillus pinihumi]|uniref:mechanosensitive ion channel family protein n=1 Tax=Paenibacillus pinihumi TaxID=669462 RepID=UPI0003FEBFF4|nr:mechanosensitive ion channel family protein [Paenibacillus pinihumi]